jgi:hypothetical protein
VTALLLTPPASPRCWPRVEPRRCGSTLSRHLPASSHRWPHVLPPSPVPPPSVAAGSAAPWRRLASVHAGRLRQALIQSIRAASYSVKPDRVVFTSAPTAATLGPLRLPPVHLLHRPGGPYMHRRHPALLLQAPDQYRSAHLLQDRPIYSRAQSNFHHGDPATHRPRHHRHRVDRLWCRTVRLGRSPCQHPGRDRRLL